MGVYLDTDSRFHRDGAAYSLECPHCGAESHMRVGSVPDFRQMQMHRPKQIGIALHCEACNKPVFIRYRVRSYQPHKIEFMPGGQQIERPAETFSHQYLPPAVAETFRDALGCYSNDFRNAFAVMCRRTALAAFESLGDRGKMRCYEQASEIQRLADIRDEDFEIVRKIIFEMELEKSGAVPSLTHMQTIILLETMKDMLHQAYVRGGKLQKALQLRRYFAEQAEEATSGGTRVTEDHADLRETKETRQQDSMIVRAVDRAGGT
jgi:hypothetical protein